MVPRRSNRHTIGRGSFCETLVALAATLGRKISDPELLAFETHYRLLLHWGRKINLTGLRSEESIVRRHFLEPIAAAILVTGPGTLLDLGSGNGFPAIPLRVLNPGLELVLVEASERRSAFLRAVVRKSGLSGVRVETRRLRTAVDLDDLLPCRYLTFRAIRGESILRKVLRGPILEPGGRAMLFVSEGQLKDIERDPLPGMSFVKAHPLPMSPGSVVAVLEPEL